MIECLEQMAIKSERPLTEWNEGHNRLKKVMKLNESRIVNKKNISNSKSNSHK